MKLKPTFVRVCVCLITTWLALQPAVAQTREELEEKRKSLQADLKRVDEKLERLREGAGPSNNEGVTYYVEAFGIYTVNSAGGVEPAVTLRNADSKSPIKYARIAMQLYDRVGKVQHSAIGDSSATQWLRFTGPLSAEDKPAEIRWEPAWYNHSGWCIVITALQLEFLDGRRRSFSGKAVLEALKPGLGNSCSVNGPAYRQ